MQLGTSTMWFLKSHLPTEGKLALITGASQGLGAELASKLYLRNCSVIMVARRESKLIEQIERIKQLHGDKQNTSIDYITTNVSDYDDCVKLWDSLADKNQDPDYFFCCVGGAICKLFPDLSKEELENGIQSNYVSSLNPIHSGVKLVLKINQNKTRKEFKQRHIILMSSVAGVYPLIGYSQYGPLKTALLSLSFTLRQELMAYNYRISCVLPGNFASEGFEEEEKTKPVITKKIEGLSVPISVSECADKVLNGLDRGYDIVYTDFIGWVLGSASLGAHPRVLGLFQVIVSFIFLLIAPVASMVVNSDISSFFKAEDKKRP